MARSAAAQVANFARLQREDITVFELEMLPGVHLEQRTITVNCVDPYTPEIAADIRGDLYGEKS